MVCRVTNWWQNRMNSNSKSRQRSKVICRALPARLIPSATPGVPEEELEWEAASAFRVVSALAWVYRLRWEFRAAEAGDHAPADRLKETSPLTSSIPKTSLTNWMAAKELRTS